MPVHDQAAPMQLEPLDPQTTRLSSRVAEAASNHSPMESSACLDLRGERTDQQRVL